MKKLLNQEQIAESVGVSVQTIVAWQKIGMPFYSAPGGRVKRYCLLEVLEWMRQNCEQTTNASEDK